MNPRLLCIVLPLALSAGSAHAQWIPTGVPVCADTCVAGVQQVIPDGTGGVYVAWRDRRDPFGTDVDVYAQRLTAGGTIAPGWPPAGVAVSAETSVQSIRHIAPDGQAGMLAVWVDGRNAQLGSNGDIYAQRVLPDGSIAPGWPLHGAPVTRAPDLQERAWICSDGAGGAYVAWLDYRNGAPDVYAQHLLADGTVAPGWDPDGNPVCVLPFDQIPDGILPDGSGGVVVMWCDCRRGRCSVLFDGDVYAQRLLADGSIAPGWAANGNLILFGRGKARMVADHDGGFYVGAADVGGFGADFEYYAQRFTFGGTRVAGWPEAGVLVCSAPDTRDGLRASSDGLGGLLLSWVDRRFGPSEIFAARVLPDAMLAPGWTPNGVLVSDPARSGFATFSDVVADGTGGAYVAWEWVPSSTRTMVQRLTAGGSVAPGFIFGGVEVAPTSLPSQFDPKLASDGAGGAIVVWDEASSASRRIGLYAQKIVPDGPVPVLVSLVSSDATHERIRLEWHMADDIVPQVGVYRRTENTAWRYLATLDVDGTGRLSYEDHDITPGETYAYRLGWAEQGIERFSQASWIEVPSAFVLALEGLRPNPATGPLSVAFSLPGKASGEIELLDVSGRRVLAQSLNGFSAGRHLIRLGDSSALAPGMYFVRLRHGEQVLVARGAIVR